MLVQFLDFVFQYSQIVSARFKLSWASQPVGGVFDFEGVHGWRLAVTVFIYSNPSIKDGRGWCDELQKIGSGAVPQPQRRPLFRAGYRALKISSLRNAYDANLLI